MLLLLLVLTLLMLSPEALGLTVDIVGAFFPLTFSPRKGKKEDSLCAPRERGTIGRAAEVHPPSIARRHTIFITQSITLSLLLNLLCSAYLALPD